MKVQPRNIEAFVKQPPANICAVLLYGPDEGLIRERLTVFTKNIVADLKDPFNIVDITGSSLQENTALLADEALSISMLGDKKVVRLREATDKNVAAIRNAVSSLTPDCNFIIIEAGELSPRSNLRAMFEKENNLAAIPCYVEDERNIAKVISTALRDAGYRANNDVINHIATNVVGDRAIARSEINKLITYMGEEKNITLEDAQKCIGNSADLSLYDIAKLVASGKFVEADRILNHVLSEGISAVAILRSLQNYFNRLLLTKARTEQGDSLDSAMKKLRPPVFFKEKSAFEAHARNWSLSAIETAMTIIISAEAQCKQTASMPETICGRAILSLSRMGVKSLGRRRY